MEVFFQTDNGAANFEERTEAMGINAQDFIKGVCFVARQCNVQVANFVVTPFDIDGIRGNVTNDDEGGTRIFIEM